MLLLAINAVILCLSVPSARGIEPDRKKPDEYQEALPMRRIAFGNNWSVGNAIFSEDGDLFFVYVPGRAINLWEVFVYYWPEALGVVLGLTTIVSFIGIRRAAQTRRILGELHCRKCNFCLKGTPGPRCPECGYATHRPIRGRPHWLRVAPRVAVLVLVAVVYGGLWVRYAPRTGWVSNWFNWWSESLVDWAQDHNKIWLMNRFQNVDRIVEYEVASGSKKRVLITRPLHMSPWASSIALVPNGSALLMPVAEGDGLALINTRTGRVTRTLTCPEIPVGKNTRWCEVAGFDDSGETAYVVAMDEANRKTILVAWDLRKERHEILLETKAYLHSFATGKVLVPRHFLRVPVSKELQFLEVPNRLEMQWKPVELRVHDVCDRDHRAPPIKTSMWGFQNPAFTSAFTPDGKRVIIHTRTWGEGLSEFDLSTGKQSGAIQMPAWYHLTMNYQIDPAHRRLVCDAIWNPPPSDVSFWSIFKEFVRCEVILVKDLVTGNWIGRYALPDHWICQGLELSPDGRYIAARGFQGGAWGKTRFVNEILLYDLRSLPHKVDFARRNEEWESMQDRWRKADEAKSSQTPRKKERTGS